jgi:putative ABC transport system ATP-binding protein
VVFLADGRVVAELRQPDRDLVLATMQELATREPGPAAGLVGQGH